jgi:hypothetical protein
MSSCSVLISKRLTLIQLIRGFSTCTPTMQEAKDRFIEHHLPWVRLAYQEHYHQWVTGNNEQGPKDLLRWTWDNLDRWQRSPYLLGMPHQRIPIGARTQPPIPARGYWKRSKPPSMSGIPPPWGHRATTQTQRMAGPVDISMSRPRDGNDVIDLFESWHFRKNNYCIEDLQGYRGGASTRYLHERMEHLLHYQSGSRGLTAAWRARYEPVGPMSSNGTGFGAVVLWCLRPDVLDEVSDSGSDEERNSGSDESSDPDVGSNVEYESSEEEGRYRGDLEDYAPHHVSWKLRIVRKSWMRTDPR